MIFVTTIRYGLYFIIQDLLVSLYKSDKQVYVYVIWIYGMQMSKQSLALAYILYFY